MLLNSLFLFFHTVAVSCLTLTALRIGREAIVAWLSLLAVSLNFFVLKQITLFGMHVTASDALAIGYLLGLNLTQEFFGAKLARKTVGISFFISLSFLILSQIHLFYQPNSFDVSQQHYKALLTPFPRILFASLISFLIVQIFDLTFFAYLRKKTEGKYLGRRAGISLVVSQALDTFTFSFIGLYGLIPNLSDIIIFSLCIKVFVILVSLPFAHFSKKAIRYEFL